MISETSTESTASVSSRRKAHWADEYLAERRRGGNDDPIIDPSTIADFEAITTVAANVCETPFALITFVAEALEWFKPQYGHGALAAPIDPDFCAHVITQDSVFIVNDAVDDPRFAGNSMVTGPPYLRFFAGASVRIGDGRPIACLCVFDVEPRPEGCNESQRTTLRVLARQLEVQLALMREVAVRHTHSLEQDVLARRLRHVAEHDPLTGLANRTLFNVCLVDAISHADTAKSRTALMLVDVDHFKQVNDSLGHDAGDRLLCSFADRLRSIVRKQDTVARLGGDEFGIILSGIDRGEELSTIVDSLSERLREPIPHLGRMIECNASVGLAIYPDHAGAAEELIKCSDLALSEAKIERGRVNVFRAEMAYEFYRVARLLVLARQALENDKIVPFYQPKIDLQSGLLVGFEALARRDDDDNEAETSEMFVAAFADQDLSAAIGKRMLDLVCSDMRAWTTEGVDFGRVAINSSLADFGDDDFAERLLVTLRMYGLSPAQLELEITEGVLLERGSHHVVRALEKLNASGVRVALDDFGTGYASLLHLKQFPVGVLKIDRSFITELGGSSDDAAIVRAIIGLGKALGLEVVAEGIETMQQSALLRAMGCPVGQGFLFGAARQGRDVPSIVAGFQ